MRNDVLLARGLGVFSLGLGAVQLAAPRAFARAIGGTGDDVQVNLSRFVGAREIAGGVGLLSQERPVAWALARVSGDLMDLALLAVALRSDGARRRERLAAATAAVAGILAVDLLASLSLSRGTGTGADDRLEDDAVGIRKSITIARPREDVYALWRDLASLPRFMTHLESVEQHGARSHWTAKAPLGRTVEWDAEITEDRQSELLAWRAVDGSQVRNSGRVRFVDAPAGRGTEVHVEMEYEPPLGVLGSTLAKLSREEPERQVADGLRRLKQLLEVGEVVRSESTLPGAGVAQRPAQPPDAVPGVAP